MVYHYETNYCYYIIILKKRETKMKKIRLIPLILILCLLLSVAAPGACVTGVETRSSSPVRILRDPVSLQSVIAGVYPVGEGAGYAGGIVSAAVDGMRAAERLIAVYKPADR